MFFITNFCVCVLLFLFYQDCQDVGQGGPQGVTCRNGRVKTSKVEGKSLLPSAVQRKLNPNNFIGIIASV